VGGKPSGILPCRREAAAKIMVQMKNVSELNKLRVRLFIEAVLNEGRLELIDELIAADFVGHIPCAEPEVTGQAGVSQLVSNYRRAHPGLHVKIVDQIAEDDRVVTRWHATVPAREAQAALDLAGRAACHAGISITRILAGKQVDSHTECTNFTATAEATGARAGLAEREISPAVGASRAWRDHHWTMDLGHLKAELDRLAGAIEHAGGRVTERDLNYVEDSAELFYERDGERYEVHLKRLPDRLPG
jgi:predicted SnoaL-like aldol condensation-catalyzing enzyme